jgi:hypothetical protein
MEDAMLLEKVSVVAPELWEPRRRYRTKKRDAYLREHRGVDPVLLAIELGVTERFVRIMSASSAPESASKTQERETGHAIHDRPTIARSRLCPRELWPGSQTFR